MSCAVDASPSPHSMVLSWEPKNLTYVLQVFACFSLYPEGPSFGKNSLTPSTEPVHRHFPPAGEPPQGFCALRFIPMLLHCVRAR